MSYNITGWNTKKLENFIIPISALKNFEYISGDPVLYSHKLVETFNITGERIKNMLRVTSIWIGHSSSGKHIDDIENLLKQSRGYMRAIVAWEGGDIVERWIVQDGVLTREEVE